MTELSEGVYKMRRHDAFNSQFPEYSERLRKSQEHEEQLYKALLGMIEMWDEVSDQINFGACCFDASALEKMNLAPIYARNILAGE